MTYDNTDPALEGVDLRLLAQVIPATANLGAHLCGRRVSDDYGSPDRLRMDDLLGASSPLDAAALAVAASRTAGQIHTALKAYVALANPIISGPNPPTPPAPPAPPTPPPAPSGAVTWDNPRVTLDQGQTGHCTAFGGAQWGNTSPVNDSIDAATAHAWYYEEKVDDGEPGAEDGSTVHTLGKVLKAHGRIAAYAWGDTAAAVEAWVLQHGPVILGTDWYNDMFEPDAGTGVVHATGGIAGGHCYIVVGYDPAARLFTCLNSWGPSWPTPQLNGRFRMDSDTLAALLAAQGEALVGLELPLAA